MKDEAEQTPGAAEIRDQLARILASEGFRSAQRSSALLRYLVEQTLAGRADSIKEYTVGVDALGRDASFDPRIDPIARVEASRLRARLEAYYGLDGATDPILVTLPRGGYVPQFARREPRPPIPTAAPKRAYVVLSMLALVLAVAAFAAGRALQRPSQDPRVPYHVDFHVGAEGTVASEVGVDMAISPDGTRLAFVLQEANGTANLYVRRLEETHATRLPGTTGARGPFISPDGRWVGFWADSKLRKTLLDGPGSPISLCDANDLLGAWWGEDGQIVAALDFSGVLWRIPADGGTPAVALDLRAADRVPRWPQVLEDGRLIYSASAHSAANPDIELYDPRTDKRTTLVRNATYGRYLPNGSLAYLSGGTVFTVPIDLSVGKTSAAPTAALKDVSYSSLFGYAQFAFARNGTLVYRRARAGNELAFVWLERSGAQTRLPIEPGEYLWPKLAPDAQRFIYMAKNAEHHDLWMHDLRTGQTSRLTSGDATYGAPTWSVDGTYIVFTGRAGTLQWTRPGVQATPQDVAGAGNVGAPWSMSPDGRLLASHGRTTEQGFDLWMTPISSDGGAVRAGQREVFRGTMAYEVFPAFSPDGKWLAYASNESGTWQVYVRAFPDTGTVVQVSSQGGRIPAWSRTTRKLFYETDDHRLMMTEYRLEGGAIEFSTPTPWSPVRLADTGVLANYDVSPDGERVVALVPADASVPSRTSELSLVTNFF